MMPGYDPRRIRVQLIIWWTFWGSSLAGLILVYLAVAWGKPLPTNVPVGESLKNLLGVVPLFVSVIIRWLVLSRAPDPARAFILQVVGVALAEACGFLGIFLGGPYRDSLFALGVLGIAQYVPLYAKKTFDPKGSGFIPNN